ncbi:MAG: NAD(P)-dependent alcohol dehydrogenase, partial [Labilibaculum sp.]|nr:NAD(P)-dependent alcohol dehydrogenase [Labilibaculum sp.]
ILVSLLLMVVTAIFAQNSGRIPAKGLAAINNQGEFEIFEFTRRPVGDNDIYMDILYAGICHSDLHHVYEDWGKTEFPIVPGHEIVGVVKEVGKNVTKFKVGDYAGIGCIVHSCGECEFCKQGLEQSCKKGMVITFDSYDYGHDNEVTKGGFSNNYVIDEQYAIKIPSNVEIDKLAPLLCAGITTYSPINFSKVKENDTVAVAGYGGLGHLALKYMLSLGAKVTVFDITEEKRQDALNMGATHYINVRNEEELKGLENHFDFIISTIPSAYDPLMYLRMLKLDGEMAIVGLPPADEAPSIPISGLVFSSNRKVYGSLIGGIPETQEMMDYSIKHHVFPQVEIIPATPEAVEKAFKNVLDGKVKFRYVIDMSTIK